MTLSLSESLASLPEIQRAKVLKSLTEPQARQLAWDWGFWGRPEQQLPGRLANGQDWFVWLIMAGRGWGKTRTAVENIAAMVRGPTPLVAPAGAPAIMSIIADTPFDLRQYSIEGPSGFLNVGPREWRPLHEPSKKTLIWPNGCRALLFSAEDPESTRGASGSFFWWDELAKSRYAAEGWRNMLFGMREGNPRGVVTTTPRPIPLIKEIAKRSSTAVTVGSTWDNKANLSETFYREVIAPLEGTRLGRQEINAEILEQAEGALWNREMIERARRAPDGTLLTVAPPMKRIVIAIDPAVSNKAQSNLTGIVAAGLGEDGRGYVLADASAQLTPGDWARRALSLFDSLEADRIVAEGNQGGEMVRHTIQTERPNAPIRIVHASRGKQARAEPVQALYQQNKIGHIGAFTELEDQMATWEPLGDQPSPDRIDALVWAFTELMLGGPKIVDIGMPVQVASGI